MHRALTDVFGAFEPHTGYILVHVHEFDMSDFKGASLQWRTLTAIERERGREWHRWIPDLGTSYVCISKSSRSPLHSTTLVMTCRFLFHQGVPLCSFSSYQGGYLFLFSLPSPLFARDNGLVVALPFMVIFAFRISFSRSLRSTSISNREAS